MMSLLLTPYAPLALAGILGAALALLRLRPDGSVPPVAVRAAHGGLGALGLLGLIGGAGRAASGDPGLFTIGLWLLGFTLLLGLGVIVAYRRDSPVAGSVVGLHATVAMFALAVLAAYLSR
ncbi:MAG: hypothetical protein JSR21_15510 [Proteobacteria bacterium]|nr:hypothetical protein [Pseudomonadota bacterium]